MALMGEYKRIKIDFSQHRETGLIMAHSDDLPGLLVPARSEDEMLAKLPAAIREILEAQGHRVGEIILDDDDNPPTGFQRHSRVAKAELNAA